MRGSYASIPFKLVQTLSNTNLVFRLLARSIFRASSLDCAASVVRRRRLRRLQRSPVCQRHRPDHRCFSVRFKPATRSDNNLYRLAYYRSRASIISVITALSYGPRLIATVVSSKLLELHGPWPLLWGSLGCSFSGVALAFFLVEPKSTNAALDDCGASGSDSHLCDEGEPAATTIGRLKAKLLSVVTETQQGFSHLLQRCDTRVIRIALCLVIMTLAWQANLSSEIMRRKFGWTWAQVRNPTCRHADTEAYY